MTQIVLYPDRTSQVSSINILTNAAWQFAYAALWPEQNFSAKEVKKVKQEISQYFTTSINDHEAFTSFCERIALVSIYLPKEKPTILPNPSIWFNCHFRQGFTATLEHYCELLKRRKQIPGYAKGNEILASHYWQYTIDPSSKAFINCRKKLNDLKEHGLIQLFYNSIVYSHLFNSIV